MISRSLNLCIILKELIAVNAIGGKFSQTNSSKHNWPKGKFVSSKT